MLWTVFVGHSRPRELSCCQRAAECCDHQSEERSEGRHIFLVSRNVLRPVFAPAKHMHTKNYIE